MNSTITQYQIKMENFEGPLDLLCHLVEKNKMDICDIKINEITNQYLEYLQLMQEMNLDITSEFIIMASKLIYLKSKSLLPSLEEDEEEEIDLVQMLIEYKNYYSSSSPISSFPISSSSVNVLSNALLIFADRKSVV